MEEGAIPPEDPAAMEIPEEAPVEDTGVDLGSLSISDLTQ
jgi:hypothetical protein